MRRWLGRRSTLFLLIIVVFIVAQLSFFQSSRDMVRRWVGGPSHFFGTVGGRMSSALSVLFTVQDLSKENVTLREQNLAKDAEIAQLRFARGENEQLKKDLQFRLSRPDLTLTPASVINYSPTNIYQALTINLGEKEGVSIGQAIVSSGFLVGKVSKVSDHTAEVWLLSNRNLVTPVLLTDSQTVGLLKGSIRGLVVENIPLDTKVQKGTPVVTSALEGLYPAGIAVGTVEEIISSKEEIFLTLRVVTPINSGNLTTVYVVRG